MLKRELEEKVEYLEKENAELKAHITTQKTIIDRYDVAFRKQQKNTDSFNLIHNIEKWLNKLRKH